ncbi:MAG: hypothetical protein M0036_15045 [Desulfobacteraceae bacterium]|nr:hypothetical protein [Desulfobacteraceae bacterium]
MRLIRKTLLAALLWLCLWGWPAVLPAQTPPEEDCRELVASFKEENRKLSEELRRIQREIAALRADLGKPGLKEIFSGIGYIVGFFGAAAFVAARRKEK